MEDTFDITFGECANLYGMDQDSTCIEDGTDPELWGGVNICSIVPSTSDSDDSPTEPEPEPSDNSPTPEPSVDSPTPEPSHAPTHAPSYAPCENFGLCETHCRGGNGACTADSCTTSGWDYEDGYANCTGYYELLSLWYSEFEEWGKCFNSYGDGLLYTCNRDTPCENYDMCITRCAYGEGDGTCTDDKCYTQGFSLPGDGFDNCNGFYTEISGMFSEFEEWGKCFTVDGRDHILTCNVDSNLGSESSPSSEADTAMIIGIVVGAVVIIAIIVCWVLYRRSQKTL
jgi:hypothetical protein